MLDQKIQHVRKNPEKYIQNRVDKFLSDPKSFDLDGLICLLAASAHYQHDDLFRQIDQTLLALRGIDENPELDHYYHISHGLFNRSINLFDQAMSHLGKAYDAAIKTEDPNLISRSLLFMSGTFSMSGDHDTAIKYAKRSLQSIPNLKNPLTIAELYLNYGASLGKSSQHEEALKAYTLAMDYYHKVPDHASYLNYAVILLNIGFSQTKLGHTQEGHYYLNTCLKLAEDHNFMTYFSTAVRGIAQFYKDQGKMDKALYVLFNYVDQQRIATKNKARSVAEKYKEEIIPHMEKIHELHRENTQLNQALRALQRSSSEDESRPVNDELMVHITQGLNKHEFIPFVQTKWCIKQQKIRGVEILARWQRANGEIKSPYFFIEHIENMDLIMTLTEQLVHQALDQLGPYIRQVDSNFKVAINVSPYQLANHDLKQFIESCCVQYGIHAKNIEIEIIERTFIENNPKAIDQLNQLSDMGCGIALDDFGAGYSSLACVAALPIDTIKIDRSLIQNIHKDPRAEKLFRSIVAMVKELELKIIAEGIETAEHLLVIQQTACDEGQGYFRDKPSPISHCHWLRVK